MEESDERYASFKCAEPLVIKLLVDAWGSIGTNFTMVWREDGIVVNNHDPRGLLAVLKLYSTNLLDYNLPDNKEVQGSVHVKTLSRHIKGVQKNDMIRLTLKKGTETRETSLIVEREYAQVHTAQYNIPLLDVPSEPLQPIPSSNFKVVLTVESTHFTKIINDMKEMVNSVRFILKKTNDGAVELKLKGLSEDQEIGPNPQKHIIKALPHTSRSKKKSDDREPCQNGIQRLAVLSDVDDIDEANIETIPFWGEEFPERFDEIVQRQKLKQTVSWKLLQSILKASPLCSSIDIFFGGSYLVFRFTVGTLGILRCSLACLRKQDGSDELKYYSTNMGVSTVEAMVEGADSTLEQLHEFINNQDIVLKAGAAKDLASMVVTRALESVSHAKPKPKPAPAISPQGKEKEKEKGAESPLKRKAPAGKKHASPIYASDDLEDVFDDGDCEVLQQPAKRKKFKVAETSEVEEEEEEGDDLQQPHKKGKSRLAKRKLVQETKHKAAKVMLFSDEEVEDGEEDEIEI